MIDEHPPPLPRQGQPHPDEQSGGDRRQPQHQPVPETGRAQATAVGQRLATLPLAAVVTSPLIRCRQTLELALPDIVPEVDEGLIECGYGDWEGRPLKELATDPLWKVVQTQWSHGGPIR